MPPNSVRPSSVDPSYQQQYIQASPTAHPREDNALRRLLGQDLEECREKQYDTYLEAKKKWSECDYDQCKAGADGPFSLSTRGTGDLMFFLIFPQKL